MVFEFSAAKLADHAMVARAVILTDHHVGKSQVANQKCLYCADRNNLFVLGPGFSVDVFIINSSRGVGDCDGADVDGLRYQHGLAVFRVIRIVVYNNHTFLQLLMKLIDALHDSLVRWLAYWADLAGVTAVQNGRPVLRGESQNKG